MHEMGTAAAAAVARARQQPELRRYTIRHRTRKVLYFARIFVLVAYRTRFYIYFVLAILVCFFFRASRYSVLLK